MNLRTLSIVGVAICGISICHAQNIDTGKERGEMDEFVNSMNADFSNFRRESTLEFVEFLQNPWKEFEETKPVPLPNPKPVPPVIYEEKEEKPVEEKPVVVEEVIAPEPVKEEPQPEPVEPIEEVPVIKPAYLEFTFFGTPGKVRLDTSALPSLQGTDETAVAGMIRALSDNDNGNLILDCLEIRKQRHLSDWAYLQMLNAIAEAAYPDNPNEAQILLGYLYMQSGYKMRFGTDGSNIYMLYASRHVIFEKPSFYVGEDTFYGHKDLPARLRISQAAFPKEQSMSLLVTSNQDFECDKSEVRTIRSKRYPEMTFDVAVNKNLIDFYSTYPSSSIGGNIMTRWAMYANTPMDRTVAEKLYPQLKEILKDKSEIDATNMLLNAVQTGLKYEYDDTVWGTDRAFFAEESLFYPYCDCEDRSILLTRMVRDLLGLDCLLIYYPGHMAAAIEYSDDNVEGDYIMLDGHKYIVADPTYINAAIGRTMQGMDNATATVIKLN